MKDKLKSILNKIKNNKKKVIGITFGVFAVFIFTFAVYNLNNPTYFNRLFANVLNNGKPANDAFEDNTFYSCVVDAYNRDHQDNQKAYTDNLTDEELASINSLECQGWNYSDDAKITSSKGVEKLTGLTLLDLGYNKLTSIDVNSNTSLTNLYLYNNNHLTSIDVSKNMSLTELDLGYNQLASIDISSNTSLTKLSLYNNQLTSIDVSDNTSLTTLYLDYNQLTSIDVSKNISLTELNLSYNKLTSIDVNSNTSLTKLSLNNNQLASIDLSQNINLKSIELNGNDLSNIDLSNNTSLTELDLSSNQLASIDLSKNINLTGVNLTGNNLFESKISMNAGDVYNIAKNIILPENHQDLIKYGRYDENIIKIENGKITALANGITNFAVGSSLNRDIQTIKVIVGDVYVFEDANFNACVVDTYNNKNGTSKSYTDGLTDEELASITSLDCSSKNINKTDGLEKMTNLLSINFTFNYNLSTLDLKKLSKLETINCYSCNLTNIDLSANKNIKTLNLAGNKLTNIDLSNNKLLENLLLGYGTFDYANNVSNIDLSNNINLKNLGLGGNGLSQLNLSNNINLVSLEIENRKYDNVPHPNTLLPDFNIKDLLFVGNKFKLDTSDINIVPPKGWKFSYSLDNENIFNINDDWITAKLSGTSNLLIKMGDITIDTKSIRVSNLEISGNYNVNNNAKYINVKDSDALNSDGSINTDVLLNNININSDVNIEKNIENNKLILKYNGDKVAEYNIIGYRVINDKLQKYNDSSTGGYKIYMGTKQFDLANDLLLLNCYAEEENDNLVIYDNNKKENVLESIRLLKISSDYYDLDAGYSENDNAYYIYVKDGSLDLNKIQLSTGLTINNDSWRITIEDDPAYGYDTYSYIYPVSLNQSSNYKIIDDCIYLGLINKNNYPSINVNNGEARKNGNQFDIYSGAGQKLDSLDIIALETDYLSYDVKDESESRSRYEYEFASSSLYLGVDTFNPAYITSKINSTYEYATDTGLLKIKHNDKLIEEIKVVNIYLPDKYKFIWDNLYLKDSEFKDSMVKSITNVKNIDKDKISVMNGKLILVREAQEDDDGNTYFEEWLDVYTIDYDSSRYEDENYRDSKYIKGEIALASISSKKYDMSNNYIYLGTEDFNSDLEFKNCGKIYNTNKLLETNALKIDKNKIELWFTDEECDSEYVDGKYVETCSYEPVEKVDSWDLVKVLSDDFDLSTSSIDLNFDGIFSLDSVGITSGSISLEGDILVIKYKDKVVKEIKVNDAKKNTTTTKKVEDIENTTQNSSYTTTTKKRNIFSRLFGNKKTTATAKKVTSRKNIFRRTTKNKSSTTKVITNKNNISTTNKGSDKTIRLNVKILVILLVSFNIIFVSALYLFKKDKFKEKGEK